MPAKAQLQPRPRPQSIVDDDPDGRRTGKESTWNAWRSSRTTAWKPAAQVIGLIRRGDC